MSLYQQPIIPAYAYGQPASSVLGALSSGQNPKPQLSPPQYLGSWMNPVGYPVQFYRLANGHRVALEQRPGELLCFRTFVDAGSNNESALMPGTSYSAKGFRPGLSHVDEHVRFVSTARYPQKNQWRETAGRYGTGYNASTSAEGIDFYLQGLAQDWTELLKLHADGILNPVYQEQNLAQEKEAILQELKLRESPFESKMNNCLSQLLFDRSILQTGGGEANVRAATVAELNAYAQECYAPQNMVTVISGNLDPVQTLQALNETFGKNPSRPSQSGQQKMKMTLAPGTVKSQTVFDPDCKEARAVLAFPSVGENDLKQSILLELLSLWLNDSRNSPLMRNLRDERQLVHQLSCSRLAYQKAGFWGINLATRPEGKPDASIHTAVSETIKQLTALKTIDPAVFNQLKLRYGQLFQQQFSTLLGSSERVGNALIQQDMGRLTDTQRILEGCTPEDLIQQLQQMLSQDRYAVVYALPGTRKTISPAQSVSRKTILRGVS